MKNNIPEKYKYITPPPPEKSPIKRIALFLFFGIFISLVIISFLNRPNIIYLQHKVMEGETIRDLSERYYGNRELWSKICILNAKKLKGKDELPVGETILIPIEKK
ncbi:MAG: LysM peptidoglycan-binding domain-containing protein [Planctomycetes bacterium]|jgi:hypothetical protein|nr:LysM peptidoglycan-binding domain-containing protein [Planctomycetota bacterium]HNZ66115.1 LysM peptidoglycan-binding domain-containing protein [Planctomycetota bacterium]HON44592.1 LysM peptidoglycan-binding domain-containing protein [Planctomycetota bacterium]HPY75002.1 LysM peptidoglycan-binding domain-containing protein [Planctomycetota bacterium]HQB01314.1 LysM peptidoglycan-binding domain-containing protein [Planctomycetota bacterium]